MKVLCYPFCPSHRDLVLHRQLSNSPTASKTCTFLPVGMFTQRHTIGDRSGVKIQGIHLGVCFVSGTKDYQGEELLQDTWVLVLGTAFQPVGPVQVT